MSWNNESRRHALASKGIKTANKEKPIMTLDYYKVMLDKRKYVARQLAINNSFIKKNPSLLNDEQIKDYILENKINFSKEEIRKMDMEELDISMQKLYSLAELLSYKKGEQQ